MNVTKRETDRNENENIHILVCKCQCLFFFFLLYMFSGLSKFAKLARSVTRSRQFAAHIPNLKDPSKQSNLAQVHTYTINAYFIFASQKFIWIFFYFR